MKAKLNWATCPHCGSSEGWVSVTSREDRFDEETEYRVHEESCVCGR